MAVGAFPRSWSLLKPPAVGEGAKGSKAFTAGCSGLLGVAAAAGLEDPNALKPAARGCTMPGAGFGASGAIGNGDAAGAAGTTGAAKGWLKAPMAPVGVVGAGAGVGTGAGATAAKAGASEGAGAPPELPKGVKEIVVVAGLSGAGAAGAAADAKEASVAGGAKALA